MDVSLDTIVVLEDPDTEPPTFIWSGPLSSFFEANEMVVEQGFGNRVVELDEEGKEALASLSETGVYDGGGGARGTYRLKLE